MTINYVAATTAVLLSSVILAAGSPATLKAVATTTSTTTTASPEALFLGLAASADRALGQKTISVKFSCANRPHGYYADVGNDCKIYHVCNPTNLPDHQSAVIHYSFFCPIGTSFDQQALICAPYPAPTPCHLAEKYYHVNEATFSEPIDVVPTAAAAVESISTATA